MEESKEKEVSTVEGSNVVPPQPAQTSGQPMNSIASLSQQTNVATTASPTTQSTGAEDASEKKSLNIKTILIGIGIILTIAIIIMIVIFAFPKKSEKKSVQKKVQDTSESSFVRVVKKAIENGTFVKEINRGLEMNSLSAESVTLLSLDIDSDNEQEIIVYAEDANKKCLLQLEVDETVIYDDSFLVDAKDSLGYAYSSEKNLNYWYTEYDKNYTIIASAKKVIKEEDFLKSYFSLTKTYDEKPILSNGIEYKMDKNLDVSRLELRAITNKGLLDNNQMKSEEIKDAYDKYLKAREEEEQKKKEEEEKQKKAEEEAKKVSGTLQLGDASYKYGTYNVYSSNGSLDGLLIIYGDLTCVHKGIDCTYVVGDVRGENDKIVTGITLSTGQIYIASSNEGELTDAEGSVSIKYAS